MFLALALLDEPVFSKQALIKQMCEDWNMNFVMEDENESPDDNNIFYVEIDGVKLGVSMLPVPVPNNESEQRARRNAQWEDAVQIAKMHKAHLVITSMSEKSAIEESKLFVKVVASVAKLEHVTGLDVAGTVLEPKFYANLAQRYNQVNALPLYNLVYFGMYSLDQKTISAYTLGMSSFKMPEMEIIASKHKLTDVHELIFMIANHVIVNNIDLRNAAEIKLTENDSVAVEYTDGVALNAKTIKIKY